MFFNLANGNNMLIASTLCDDSPILIQKDYFPLHLVIYLCSS